MAEEGNDSHRNHSPTARRRLVTAACLAIAAVAAILPLIWLRQRPSVEEQLRAIDAAHAIPEEENAARIYTRLVEEANLPSLDSSLLPRNLALATPGQPWRDVDFPQAAAWIKERQKIVELLLEAGRQPQCWFPVSGPRVQVSRRIDAVMDWHVLLVRAANNDLGEGRVEAGLEKMLCMLRLARHYYSQSSPSEYFPGVTLATMGLMRFERLVVVEGIPSEWLAQFEAALPPVEGPLTEQLQHVEEVSQLQWLATQPGVLARLVDVFTSGSSAGETEDLKAYKAECRIARLLLALRRYRNRIGAWPADLREIRNEVPPVALSDPLNGKSFVYRLEGDGFILYSTGTDGVDDGGNPPGDRPFWPR